MYENEYATIDPNSSKDTSSKRYRITNAVEIPLLLLILGSSIAGAPISNLVLYRTCVHELNHSTVECQSFLSPDKMNYTPEEQVHMKELEREVQEYANLVNTVSSVLGALVPSVLSLFIGVWSDKHGRKPLLMWSLLGMALSSMVLVVYSMVQSLGPWWLVASSAFFSLFGGFGVMVIGAMCFITDATDNENRTLRLMIAQMLFAVGMAAGGLVSPYLLRAVGTVYLFLIVAVLQTCAYAFSALVLEESLIGIVKGSIFTVLDIKEMIRECFKERPNHGRATLLLTVSASTLYMFTMTGASGLLYLYTRNKLQWTMKDFTTFSSINTVWMFAGFFGVALLQKLFRITDLSFAAIAMFSRVFENIIKATAITSWQMYLGSVIALFGSVSEPMIRSFLTKTLPSQDIGKAFGLMGSAESFCPLLAPLVYNALYAFTLSDFPGAFLLLTASIHTVALTLVLIVKCLVKRSSPVVIYDDD